MMVEALVGSSGSTALSLLLWAVSLPRSGKGFHGLLIVAVVTITLPFLSTREYHISRFALISRMARIRTKL